jgi:hypothetical protein
MLCFQQVCGCAESTAQAVELVKDDSFDRKATPIPSLPFDGGRGFAADVVDDTVDAFDAVGDRG